MADHSQHGIVERLRAALQLTGAADDELVRQAEAAKEALNLVFFNVFEPALRAGRARADEWGEWRELFVADPDMVRLALSWDWAAAA